MYMLGVNSKAPCLPVSERKNFEVGLLCSYVPSCDPQSGTNFDPHMNKLGRGPQGEATNQI